MCRGTYTSRAEGSSPRASKTWQISSAPPLLLGRPAAANISVCPCWFSTCPQPEGGREQRAACCSWRLVKCGGWRWELGWLGGIRPDQKPRLVKEIGGNQHSTPPRGQFEMSIEITSISRATCTTPFSRAAMMFTRSMMFPSACLQIGFPRNFEGLLL